jgi:hypothetical protein
VRVASRKPSKRSVFERSPPDYLAYAAASRRAWGAPEVDEFIAAYTPVVRSSVRQLGLIAFLPLSAEGAAPRPGEGKRFRRQVDLWLRRILLDDEYELFERGCPPLVVALPTRPADQLQALHRHVSAPLVP